MQPRALILRTAGTNCDLETAHAFHLAGAEPQFVHVNRVLEAPQLLDRFQILSIPGGFSYGDDIAAGRIFAKQLSHHLGDHLRRFVDSGRPIIGICNGFQVLVKTELLPGPIAGRTGQACTLAHNDSGRFIDRWIHLAPRSQRCIWTRGIRGGSAERESIELPVAHGEGKLVPRDEPVRTALWDEDLVALVYVREDGSPAEGEFPDNPNGSVDDIAGICDPSGLILGLMPHPERYVDALQHPAWTSRRDRNAAGEGLQMFRNAVEHVQEAVGAGI
jgi:phosphoribosylformylglycinamidine synthase subunit PurQ / glutaminase